MTRSSWLNPANGDFGDPSNWSNGVPGSSDTAIFDVGSKPYAVTTGGQTTGTVHIEAGHVLFSGTLNASSLNVDQGSVVGFEAPSSDTAPAYDFGSISNAGVLQAIDGLDFQTSNDTVIRNLSAGTLTGGAWEAIGASSVVDLTGGPIVVLAATVTLSGYRADLETHEDSNSSIPLERSLTTIAAGGRLMLGDDSFFSSYSPGLEIESGGSIALSNGVHGADLDQMYGVTLDAGSRVTGNGSIGATVNAKAGSITAASGGIIAFQGFRDTFYGTFAGPGTVELSSGADTIEAGARVHSGGLFLSDSQVSLDENLTYNGGLEMFYGTLDLEGHRLNLTSSADLRGGTIQDGSIILHGASINNLMTLDAPVANDGTTLAFGGDLNIKGAVSGSGAFQIGAGSSVEFGGSVGASQTVTFLDGNNDVLRLDDARAFRGTITGFASGDPYGFFHGDTIDLTTFASSNARISFQENAAGTAGTLHVTSGSNRAVLTLDGDYLASAFQATSDMSGNGTAVTYAPPPSSAGDLAAAHA